MGCGAQAYVQVDVDGNATANLFIDLIGLSTPLMACEFGLRPGCCGRRANPPVNLR